VNRLGNGAIATPAYLAVAWTLMISYQIFTETAVTSVVAQINALMPAIGSWLSSRIDIVVFVYAFAWVFVLSSALPSAILGKERSVIVQFFVCLSLTLFAFVFMDLLTTYGGTSLEQILNLSILFNNPFLAAIYLSIPYITMLALDLRARKKNKEKSREMTFMVKDFESPAPELPNN
jgi:hypothetical protein